jgi:hypothetical protein
MALVYGLNTFSIYVTYSSIKFNCTCQVQSTGLLPNSAYDYLDFFPPHILHRIKNYVIFVEHVDSYMGMIKYNCGGKGLSEGVKRQIKRLVDELRRVDRLGKIVVRLEGKRVPDIYQAQGVGQSVLEPFRKLEAVGWPSIGGNVEKDFALELKRDMMGSAGGRVGIGFS